MRHFTIFASFLLLCGLAFGCGGQNAGTRLPFDGDLDGVNSDGDSDPDTDAAETDTPDLPDGDTTESAGETDTELPSDGDDVEPSESDMDSDVPFDGDSDTESAFDNESDSAVDGDTETNACTTGTTQCSLDGYGFEACGLAAGASSNSFGNRVPCDANQTCTGGVCAHVGCRAAEVLFLLDRSSSMTQSGVWTWVKPTFTAALSERARANYFGFRQFPQGDCTAGVVMPLATNNATSISAGITDPTVSASTPIAAALSGLASSFGDPNDGQAVVLITDGEETCGTQTEALQAASALFRAGVKVYVVAVTTTANRSFLDQLAQVGGTGTSRLVRDAMEFSAALETIYGEVGARRCDPGNLCCETDGCALADPTVVCASYANACNKAACNEVAGTCYSDFSFTDDLECDDDNPCTYGDKCASGTCTGIICNNHGACNNGDSTCTCTTAFAGSACNQCASGAFGTYPGCYVMTPGFVRIAAGTFMMGSPLDELGRDTDETRHAVTLTYNFEMKTTPVTQGEFTAFTGRNPSHFSTGGGGTTCGATCPVESVDWHEAIAYANWLSTNAGLTPCYLLTDCTGTLGGGCYGSQTCTFQIYTCTVALNGVNRPQDCEGFRLPTEAEWEYAVRAGTTTATYNGNLTYTDNSSDPALAPIAWYGFNAGGTPHPVGVKTPNAWGLYDMLGNVWEWTGDLDGPLSSDAVTDPTGASSGAVVCRGGAWTSYAQYARSAFRGSYNPKARAFEHGFRLVRSLP